MTVVLHRGGKHTTAALRPAPTAQNAHRHVPAPRCPHTSCVGLPPADGAFCSYPPPQALFSVSLQPLPPVTGARESLHSTPFLAAPPPFSHTHVAALSTCLPPCALLLCGPLQTAHTLAHNTQGVLGRCLSANDTVTHLEGCCSHHVHSRHPVLSLVRCRGQWDCG